MSAAAAIGRRVAPPTIREPAPAARDTFPIPFLPPLVESPQLPTNASTVARLMTLGTVAITVDTGESDSMIVFLDRQPTVAIARRGSTLVTGQDALEAIGDIPLERLRLFEIRHDLARVVGAYFLPTAVRDLPASTVRPDAFIGSFARPGQQACVIVRTPEDLGLAFLDDGNLALAYCMSKGKIGRLDQIADLLEQPGALLTARLPRADGQLTGELPEDHAPQAPGVGVVAVVKAQPVAAAAPDGPAVVPAPRGAPAAPNLAEPPLPTDLPHGDLAAFVEATSALQAPADPPPSLPPVEELGSHPDPDLLEAVLDAVRSLVGRHSVRIEETLRQVEPTPEAIESAVRGLRNRGVRLLSAETLDAIVDRTLAVLRQRDTGRGQPG